jgi:hypothetical protein
VLATTMAQNVVEMKVAKKRFDHVTKQRAKCVDATVFTGFSDRLNFLIDLAYPQAAKLEKGRGSWLSEVTGAARPTTSEWLLKNKVPQDATFDRLVAFLLENIAPQHNIKRVKAWLQYGEEVVANPFQQYDDVAKGLLPLAVQLIDEVTKKTRTPNTSYDLKSVITRTLELLASLGISDAGAILPAHRKLIAEYFKLHRL